MKNINIVFSDEDWEILQETANKMKMSVQDYIRQTMLKKKKTIFTVDEAEHRALAQFKQGKEFSLPDLYTDDEWRQLPRANAGVFGRNFFKYVESNSSQIEFTGMYRRIARYRIK